MSRTFETEENTVGKCPDCSVEVGTVFDGEDCGADLIHVYETEALAREALGFYTEKARKAESEPCEITSEINAVDGGYELKAHFEFCCQAEKVIFQLSTR
ncbi:YfcZ/YiiS family protein [Neisseria sp.]|uniref:YfcZ/YiiS family protein n=1 Tax=Neisseria sp. TaxID=192066 RepID=UPI00359F3580